MTHAPGNDPEPFAEPFEALFSTLFSTMGEPAIPESLRSEEFLESIYARAAAEEEVRLAPILAATLTPRHAPMDATWVEVREHPGLTTQVETVLAAVPVRAPGMLWTRIRADLHAQRESRRNLAGSRFMRRAAAALLLGTSVIGLVRFLHRDDGTRRAPSIVIREVPSLAIDWDLFSVR